MIGVKSWNLNVVDQVFLKTQFLFISPYPPDPTLLHTDGEFSVVTSLLRKGAVVEKEVGSLFKAIKLLYWVFSYSQMLWR